MNRCHRVYRDALISSVAIFVATCAIAQSGSKDASQQVPGWLVWRAFYSSLEFYARESPDAVTDLLKERLQLAPDEVKAFRSKGDGYLAQLLAIEDEARVEIASRYKSPSNRLPRQAPQPGDLVRTNHPGAHAVLVPGRTPDGRSVREATIADGLAARVETQKAVVVRAHIQDLEQLLGRERVIRLQQWIASDVEPNVSIGGDVAPQIGKEAPFPAINAPQAR